MTREDRWIVSLDEIRALRWECPACSVALVFALNQTIRLPVACPSCNADMLDPNGPAQQAAADFVRALKTLIQTSGRAGTLRLEFLTESPVKEQR
jgi:hypothetical protein